MSNLVRTTKCGTSCFLNSRKSRISVWVNRVAQSTSTTSKCLRPIFLTYLSCGQLLEPAPAKSHSRVRGSSGYSYILGSEVSSVTPTVAQVGSPRFTPRTVLMNRDFPTPLFPTTATFTLPSTPALVKNSGRGYSLASSSSSWYLASTCWSVCSRWSSSCFRLARPLITWGHSCFHWINSFLACSSSLLTCATSACEGIVGVCVGAELEGPSAIVLPRMTASSLRVKMPATDTTPPRTRLATALGNCPMMCAGGAARA
mmetsp:Transcript_106308/g.328262  ORF Transcript_106308/g.328262 Transcript_106308/m.328262 type:complete len:258 (+) Transcript_106308:426-1199(+)